jgi:hypothetical protein
VNEHPLSEQSSLERRRLLAVSALLLCALPPWSHAQAEEPEKAILQPPSLPDASPVSQLRTPTAGGPLTELEAAQQEAETNRLAEVVAEGKVKDVESALDLAKSGKLMASGITIGTAAAVQVRLRRGSDVQRGAELVVMPYLMMLPGYFGAPQPLREYCASAWGVGDDAEASAAAFAAARKTARKRFEAIVADIRIGMTEEQVVHTWFAGHADMEFGKVLVKQSVEYAKENDRTRKEARELELLDALTSRAWNPTLRGNCFIRSFGVWVGRPLGYTTATRLPGDPDNVERKIHPVVAMGLGYTPHAYVSVLVGLTLAKVEQDSGPEKTFWATTLAMGGNIDIVGALLK